MIKQEAPAALDFKRRGYYEIMTIGILGLEPTARIYGSCSYHLEGIPITGSSPVCTSSARLAVRIPLRSVWYQPNRPPGCYTLTAVN